MAKRTAHIHPDSLLDQDSNSDISPGVTASALPVSSFTRVTRSQARLAADPSAVSTPTAPARSTTRASTTSKKRKAAARLDSSPADPLGEPSSQSPPRRPKRQKVKEATPESSAPTPPRRTRRGALSASAMSNNGSSSRHAEEASKSLNPSRNTSKRPPSRSKKVLQETSPSSSTPPARRQKKAPKKRDTDVVMKEEGEPSPKPVKREAQSPPPLDRHDSNEAEGRPGMGEDDLNDPFASGLLGAPGRGPPVGLSSTLRALSGMMSGMGSRLRDILNNLKQVDNPTMQLVALEDLSNLLLVSNEDNLSGQFSPDPYVKELVSLMQPNPLTGEENPEMMLLACRCIANLMEALRGSVANVVYGGAVPVLCQKLLDIQYIDVAEQALSTLSKISIDFPASIVREGGLTACLQFLDFFATGTQRTAVTTAANCCRNIPHDSFPVIRDVMPIFQNVLVSHDQKVVEQGCLCVTRVIDSFKHSPERLEQLVDPPLLKLILGLLLPGTTNLIGPHVHTEFLRVLAIVARASPQLSFELLRMRIVDTLYHILTGVSPPGEASDAASKIDSVMVMQALIHRPREQVYETLSVICELLPRPKGRRIFSFDDYDNFSDFSDGTRRSRSEPSPAEKRLELLKGCKVETRRFATVLLPTLTDAYSSTVNLSVRQKVLTAQLKILSNLDTDVVEEALRPVPYASFLASILSQEDHPSLVMFALQASELLFERLENIYQYQFYREGVIGEIRKLADRPLDIDMGSFKSSNVPRTDSMHSQKLHRAPEDIPDTDSGDNADDKDDEEDSDERDEDAGGHGDQEDEDHGDDADDADDDDDDDEGDIVVRDGGDHMTESLSSASSDGQRPSPTAVAGIGDIVVLRAKKFLELYDTARGHEMRDKASNILLDLQSLAKELENCYLGDGDGDSAYLFERLATFFGTDPLESITSSELLSSNIIGVLLNVFTPLRARSVTGRPRADFLKAFMGDSNPVQFKVSTAKTTTTALGILIMKLQDLLSRAEHFEVLTVNSSASENSRSSSTSMLSKQLRLKLTADDDSDIPPGYRDITVSIHAIATFKALDDYLRPRISLSERPPSSSRRRDMISQLANARMRELAGASDSGLLGLPGSDSSFMPPVPLSSGRSKTSRLSTRAKQPVPDKAEVEPTTKNEKPAPRRSSRRHQPSSSAVATPPPPPIYKPEDVSEQLEIADERHLSSDGADPDGPHALEAIVDGLEDELSDNDIPEPTAVNMEIASTGKVTARKEDGTRVATPMQPGTPVHGTRSASSSHPADVQPPPRASLAVAGRSFSYAAALASIPHDWHIEFSIDGKQIPKETTIYQAVYHNRGPPGDVSSRSIWSGIHAIKYKRVKGPPPESRILQSAMDRAEERSTKGMPASLDKHPITSSILALLSILHELNFNLTNALEIEGRAIHTLVPEPVAQFINTKLTAKMNRQLEEPLIVASNCLPSWSEDLARMFPFLFPFETRHLFLQSTSFGYSRSMMRWQSAQTDNDDRDRRRDDRPLMGRLQRQKVRISRTRILESAVKVMEMYGASPSVLEVEYFEEVGTGLGPTLEFYSTVSKEFSKKKLKMWRENESDVHDEYAFGRLGLFPAPMSDDPIQSENNKKLLHVFKMLGKFVARSMLDSRIIDVSFNPTFFRLGSSPGTMPSLALVKTVDEDLANSLAQVKQFAATKHHIEQSMHLSATQKVRAVQDINFRGARLEDLMLDFTLPGYPSIELINNGSNIAVTTDNVGLYVERVLDLTLGSGVQRQIEAFKAGVSQVFSYSSLKAFTPNELVMLFGRVEEDWTIETLMDSIKADHGFNMDSRSVKNLLQTMSELSRPQRRDFLQFVTGSPKLPIGGFKSLTPMFTVVCKPSEPPYTSDDYLPSVMTCVNYLKLPDYTNLEVLRERLNVAIQEGQGAFHLS